MRELIRIFLASLRLSVRACQQLYCPISLILLENELQKRLHLELKLLENKKYGHKFFVHLCWTYTSVG